MVNAADKKSIRAAEKAAKLAEANRRAVLVGLMSTIPGREWIWNRLERANIFSSTFDPNLNVMAFLEGRRAEGLALLDDVLAACPEEFILAMREQNARRTEHTAADAANHDPTTGQRADGEEPRRESEGPSSDDPADDGADGVAARLKDLGSVYQNGSGQARRA